MKKTAASLLTCFIALGFVASVRAISLSSTAQLVLPGATLADLSTHTLIAHMGDFSFDNPGTEVTFFDRQETEVNGVLTKVTYQLQAIDTSYVKAAKVEFTDGEGGVHARFADGNFANYSSSFSSFGDEPLSDNPVTYAYSPSDFELAAHATAISVNFTHGGKGLGTSSSVRYGAGAYAVPYSSWNNMLAANNGTATFGGVTVTITGTRGSYSCTQLSVTNDLRQGYIDESGTYATPTVTVTGIPYQYYRVVAYAASDARNVKFGHMTINGKDYTGTDGATIKGTDSWGSTGDYNTAKGLREGVNYLVSDVESNSTATIVGNRGGTTVRGCIAAVQIVEFVPPVVRTATIDDGGAKSLSGLSWDDESVDNSLPGNKIVVNVNEDTTLDVGDALELYWIEFNVAAGKTLTLTGEDVFAKKIAVNGLGHVIAGDPSQLRGSIVGDGNLVVSGGLSMAEMSSFDGMCWIYGTTAGEGTGVVSDTSVRSFAGRIPPAGVSVDEWVVSLDETREEFGKGGMTVTDVPAGVTLHVTRPDNTTTNITPSEGTATLSDPVKIAGEATLLDITFKNNEADSGWFTYKADAAFLLKYDSNATFNNSEWDDTTGVYIKHHPYVSEAGEAFVSLGDFTAVVVGTVSPTPRRQFIHIGSSSTGGQGILIATTENDNEVLIAVNSEKEIDVAGGVKASVPNAATARHAFVVVRKGNTFNVWVDGVKRGSFTVADGFAIGRSTAGNIHSGIQVGSDFGGTIKNAKTYEAVSNSDSETGVANVIRVFDYAISDAQAEEVFNAYPYVSQGGLFSRTVDGDGTLSETGAWTKSGDAETYAVPVGATVDDVYYNPSATLTVNASSEIEVNADLAVETLTVGGSAAVAFASDGTHAMRADAVIVNSPVTIEHGALDISAAPVQLGSSGSIAFDCSTVEMPLLWTQSRLQLTGLIDRDDARVTLAAVPTAAYISAVMAYNESVSCYDLVMTPVSRHGVWAGTVDGNLCDARNWMDGTLPLDGEAVIIGSTNAVTLTIPEGMTFNPSSITFPEGSASVTIEGPGTIPVVSSITNLSTATHDITVPMHFADKISVVQLAKSYDSRGRGSVRFSGGAYGTSMDADASHYINGHYFLSESNGITANVQQNDTRYGMSKGSSLTVPEVSSLYELALGWGDCTSTAAGGAFTTGVYRTSSRILCFNEGEFVVTNELAVALPPNADLHLAWNQGGGAFKFEKVTLGDSGVSKWLYFAMAHTETWPKNVWIGEGGLNFAPNASENTCYCLGYYRTNDVITVRPWHADYTIAAKTNGSRDVVVQMVGRFGTTDENGVARTVTCDGRLFNYVPAGDRRVEIFGAGRFVVNAVNPLTVPVSVTDTATLAINPGKKMTEGTTTVNEGAALEVAQSGTVAFGGALELKNGATLAFNYTQRGTAPVLDLTGKTVSFAEGAATNVTVKIASDLRPGVNARVLTSGGGFAGVNVSLADGAPEWATGVTVNEDGNIALEVKRSSFGIIIR